MPRNGPSGSTTVSDEPSACEPISRWSRFSLIARCRRNGPRRPEAGAKLFSRKRSAIATARSCSISGLRRRTVCSSSVISAIRRLSLPTGVDLAVALPAWLDRAEPDREGQRVSVETFGLGQPDCRRRQCGEARRRTANERAPLHEVEHAEPGGKTRAAGGRQHMVGTGYV